MKRLYKDARVAPHAAGTAILLDGRPARTPRRNDLVVPSPALAQAIAAEWAGQSDTVRPHTMPMTRLAATTLDVVAAERARIAEDVAGYAGTDLVCYRAHEPADLVQRQVLQWQPLVDWVMARFDAPLKVTVGVVPVAQPEATLRALRRAVEVRDDWRLAALASATAATGSLVIALAMAEGRLTPDDAWHASQLDEGYQIEQWGEDPEAALRRGLLRADILAARRFLDLLDGHRPEEATP